MSKRLNNLLKKTGVLTSVTKETELLALLRDSPCTNDEDASSAIAITRSSEEELCKTRASVNRITKTLPQWKFGTKLNKENLVLYIGKYEKEPVSETTTEVQP